MYLRDNGRGNDSSNSPILLHDKNLIIILVPSCPSVGFRYLLLYSIPRLTPNFLHFFTIFSGFLSSYEDDILFCSRNKRKENYSGWEDVEYILFCPPTFLQTKDAV